ncbi:hypothetical protein EJA72_28150 [Pseudomonas sp. PB120]|uniref:hypothetical protein n=1 Tax=Pseudomonas sp. PB120 TaxID=2494700 RepID=UPI0012FE251A|nr:hypothetical protein [Pseudomonas sp. PB120]MVV52080.1 hypothetical protein [Pseudomonas sp. PB120]
MSGAKHSHSSSAHTLDTGYGHRLVAVSDKIELIAARARSQADIYFEEESNALSKYAAKVKATRNDK